MKKQFLEAGKIVNTHGIRGEVKIQPWTSTPDFLTGFSTIYIDNTPVRMLHCRVHKTLLIAQLEQIDNVEDAMRLKNKVVYIDREDARLEEGEFFIQDILGAYVQDESGVRLGTLKDVMELPAGNVYVVEGDREILIPAVPDFILHTDAEAGVITVRLIKGM